MSIYNLSGLAVQDISDESASIHSGGVGFTWANNANGTNSSPVYYEPDNFTNPAFHSFTYSTFNNNIESFRINQAVAGRKYRVDFYDGNDGATGFMGSLNLDYRNNDKWLPLATSLRNRTSSLRVTRTA